MRIIFGIITSTISFLLALALMALGTIYIAKFVDEWLAALMAGF